MKRLERAIEGEAPMTGLQWINRICEEFHCTPAQAYREWMELPAGCLEDLIEMRAFERAYRLVKAANTEEQRKALPTDSPMVQLALELEIERMHESYAALQAEAAESETVQ